MLWKSGVFDISHTKNTGIDKSKMFECSTVKKDALIRFFMHEEMLTFVCDVDVINRKQLRDKHKQTWSNYRNRLFDTNRLSYKSV